jgi:phage FluMu protein Com
MNKHYCCLNCKSTLEEQIDYNWDMEVKCPFCRTGNINYLMYYGEHETYEDALIN